MGGPELGLGQRVVRNLIGYENKETLRRVRKCGRVIRERNEQDKLFEKE